MSERPIILKSAKKPDSMGMIMDFFVVSSENLEFVGWHSGALPWSISFLVEDWSFSLNIWTWFFLQIDDEARFLASSTYPLLPPTSLLFCWVLTESKKKNIICFIKENLLPKRNRRYLKEKNLKKTGQKTFEVLELIWRKRLEDFEKVKEIIWRISSILEGSLVFAEASLLNNFRWVTSHDVYI